MATPRTLGRLPFQRLRPALPQLMLDCSALPTSPTVARQRTSTLRISPVVSEKSYGLLDEGKYTFIVDPRSNKTEIKIAVEQVFNVRVLDVNTLNRQGKRKRTRSGFGRRKDTKRAIVSLAPGDRIEIFGGPVS